jgi:hypothetical protein
LEKTNLFNWLNLARKETHRIAGAGWLPRSTCGEFVFNFLKMAKILQNQQNFIFWGFSGGKKREKKVKVIFFESTDNR